MRYVSISSTYIYVCIYTMSKCRCVSHKLCYDSLEVPFPEDILFTPSFQRLISLPSFDWSISFWQATYIIQRGLLKLRHTPSHWRQLCDRNMRFTAFVVVALTLRMGSFQFDYGQPNVLLGRGLTFGSIDPSVSQALGDRHLPAIYPIHSCNSSENEESDNCADVCGKIIASS